MATLNIRNIGKLNLNKGVSIEDALKELKKRIELKKSLKSKSKPKIKRSKYIELLEVVESKDKKSIIFNFKNNAQFSYNLLEKKIQNLSGKLNDVELYEGEKLENLCQQKKYHKIISCSKEKWIETFFKICANYNENHYYGDKPVFLSHKIISDKIEIISKIQDFQDIEDYSFLEELINSRTFKTSLKDVGIDNWFIENFIKDERLWDYLDEYNKSKIQNKVEFFRYCWENHKLGRSHSFLVKSRYLLEKGYEEKRLVDYLCKEVATQGLRPFVQESISDTDYYEVEDDDQYHDYIHYSNKGLMYSDSSLDLLICYVKLQDEGVYEKFPKHLKTELDLAIYKRNLKKDKILEKEYEKIYNSLKVFEFEDEEYCVIAPNSPKEVVSEGAILDHCVADYAQDVARGRTKIFFIRLKASPGRPLLTMQVIGKTTFKINMVRGKKNRHANDRENLFLDKYRKHLKNIKQ